MRVLFLGRKPAGCEALRRLVARGYDVAAVVAPHPGYDARLDDFARPLLHETAEELGLRVVTDLDLYEAISKKEMGNASDPAVTDIDLVVSFLFWKRIKPSLITLPRIGCFNFHPAPLPEFRGRRGYNFAILEGHHEYGASIHWMADEFDCGDLVEVRPLPISPDETALSLEWRTMTLMLEMLDDFLDLIDRGGPIPAVPQVGGNSATKAEMLAAAAVHPDDSAETVRQKVRAFWYPPHSGATVIIDGKSYTLVDDDILAKLGGFIHGSRERPW